MFSGETQSINIIIILSRLKACFAFQLSPNKSIEGFSQATKSHKLMIHHFTRTSARRSIQNIHSSRIVHDYQSCPVLSFSLKMKDQASLSISYQRQEESVCIVRSPSDTV